jgi:hypothetical protein
MVYAVMVEVESTSETLNNFYTVQHPTRQPSLVNNFLLCARGVLGCSVGEYR